MSDPAITGADSAARAGRAEVTAAERSTDGSVGTAGTAEAMRTPRSPAQLAVRRFWSNLGARVSVVALVLIVLAVVIGPYLLGIDPDAQNLTASRQPPGSGHLLGTDLLGRDVLSRLLAGGRVSILVGLATAASALALGTVIGVVAGSTGGQVDSVLMRITDIFMAVPSLLVVIVCGGILGPSVALLVGLIAAFAWPTSARIARSVVLSVRELDFVKAATAAGTRRPTIMRRHLLPAVIPQVTVSGAMLVATAILSEAALSYLGLGVVPPQASWGNMLQNAQSFTVISSMPWLWLSPGLAIILTSVSVIFIGDGMRDALDPEGQPVSLLEVMGLSVEFATLDGPVHAVRDLSFTLEAGEALGIVGESGSGKTVSVLTVMRLLPPNARVTGGQVLLDGTDILRLSERQMRGVRGKRVSMVFQDPMTALNPVARISTQVGNTVEYHDRKATRREVRRRVVETLESVGVPDADRRADQYPHQWSGGMRQRAVIAMALVNEPELIVADEPTTALDATVQAQVLDVLRQARADRGCSLILISHDLGVVREVADDVLVMYAGTTAERCDREAVFIDARHPYTRALVRARPGWGPRTERLFTIAGRPPDLLDVPQGCPFEPRCTESQGLPACRTTVPPVLEVGPDHVAACHRARELEDLEDLDPVTVGGGAA